MHFDTALSLSLSLLQRKSEKISLDYMTNLEVYLLQTLPVYVRKSTQSTSQLIKLQLLSNNSLNKAEFLIFARASFTLARTVLYLQYKREFKTIVHFPLIKKVLNKLSYPIFQC